jgi:hypothetical protein
MYLPGLHQRAPRLRWSRPKFTPKRGTVAGTCKVRQGKKLEPREAIKRLGKTRGAILDVLDSVGGVATLQEIADALHKKRPRDIRRRNLPMLEEDRILTVEEDVVALADDWLERLADARALGKEIEAEERARRRLELKRKAYHARHQIKPDKAPTPEELAAQREHFEAALEARRRARDLEIRDKALAAFRPGSGAAKNLSLFMDGELLDIQALVQSVLAYHDVPVVRWEQVWKRWRDPVVEAGAILAREQAADPAPDLRKHELDCSCDACIYPETRYARPRSRRGGVP